MIYKFKVWVWLPMTTEIHLSATSDEDANKTFNKIDLSKALIGEMMVLENLK